MITKQNAHVTCIIKLFRKLMIERNNYPVEFVDELTKWCITHHYGQINLSCMRDLIESFLTHNYNKIVGTVFIDDKTIIGLCEEIEIIYRTLYKIWFYEILEQLPQIKEQFEIGFNAKHEGTTTIEDVLNTPSKRIHYIFIEDIVWRTTTLHLDFWLRLRLAHEYLKPITAVEELYNRYAVNN